MRGYMKLLGKSALLVAACIAVGFALLLAAFALPTQNMEKNVYASAGVFAEEGSYPEVDVLGIRSMLSNSSDALMLMSAGYRAADASLIERMVNVYRPLMRGEDAAQVIVSCYGEGETPDMIVSYGRYWHGYMLTLKPLLSVFNYSQICVVNAAVVAALALWLVVLLWRRQLKRYILPYGIALLLINPFAIAQSLHSMSVYCVYSAASIAFLWKRDWLMPRRDRLLLFFTLTGCLTSYFDLLTFPFISFGVPAVFYLCCTQENWKQALKSLLLMMVSWFVGYVGMWAGKWVLGTLLGGGNLLEDALQIIRMRTSMSSVTGESVSLYMLIKRQLYRIISPALALAAAYLAVTGVCFARRAPRQKLAGKAWAPFIALCVLPFVWYVCAANHSYVHAFFTYRELVITALSGMCLFAKFAAKPHPPALKGEAHPLD